MEKHTSSPEQIHLIGPDGWRFSVDKPTNTSVQVQTDLPPPEGPRYESPLAYQQTENLDTTHSFTSSSSESNSNDSDLLDNPVVLGGGALALVAAGVVLVRAVNNPSRFEGTGTRKERAARRRASDAQVHRDSAQNSINRFTSNPQPIDRVANFKKTHRTRRLGTPIQAGGNGGFTPVPATEARTITQNRAAMRANLREDAINDRVSRADKYLQLYGDVVLDQEVVDQNGNITRPPLNDYIEQNRFSKKYIKALRRASRKVHRLQGTENRIRGRLERQANGNDIHSTKNRVIGRILRD